VRALIASIAALVLPLSLSSFAVAADEQSSPKSWTAAVGSESPDQAIQGMSFLPNSIYVNAGDTITSETNSTEIHTVTFPARGQCPKRFSPSVPTVTAPLPKPSGDPLDNRGPIAEVVSNAKAMSVAESRTVTR
jgi:plastocyanin